MIAIAGYLNFAGSRISEEEILETGADSAVTAKEDAPDTEDTQVASLFEISDEDMEAAENYDIASLDSDVISEEPDYLDETMQESMAENTGDELSDQSVPGEAVFTSSSSLDSLSTCIRHCSDPETVKHDQKYSCHRDHRCGRKGNSGRDPAAGQGL